MAQQTAVDWLFEQIPIEWTFSKWEYEAYQRAKQMEKEQIINAHGTKVTHNIKMGMDVYEYKIGTEYYNETYGTE
jgi:hypothetical protein